MDSRSPTSASRATKRGAFLNGLWHCDCEPRLPAEKFQTKNGGKNHGRWFYTCQKPQHKRCGFFLWADETKTREEMAVLNNTRSEPDPRPMPKTPQKYLDRTEVPSPSSRPRSSKDQFADAERLERTDSFGWSTEGDEELAMGVGKTLGQTFAQTPRKVARTHILDSPGKQYQGDKTRDIHHEIQRIDDNVFAAQSPKSKPHSTGLMSPEKTPLQSNFRAVGLLSGNGETEFCLASEALAILNPAKISQEIENQLVDLLRRHELRSQGILKGRDITRIAVQTKEKKIAELQTRITELEAERETSRTVIAHLKQTMANAFSKGGGKGRQQRENQQIKH